jgi:archaemetzincin
MNRKLICCSFLLLFAFTSSLQAETKFKPPDQKARTRAIGPINNLSPLLQRVYQEGHEFEPIPAPEFNDWLAQQKEPGQTVFEFVRSRPNRPDEKRDVIYIRPLGKFPEKKKNVLQDVADYAAVFFQMTVVMLDEKPLERAFTTRIHPQTNKTQILSKDILAYLAKDLPKDAYCEIAVTMTDLYPDPQWNFVFGQAALKKRVGVYSFARYDPNFPNANPDAEVSPLFLRRCMKVFVHETGHMFGMKHCIYFSCIMNGSNHLGESDSREIHLCPVCLRKLAWSTQHDPLKRYKELNAFYKQHGLETEADWLGRRLKTIKQE